MISPKYINVGHSGVLVSIFAEYKDIFSSAFYLIRYGLKLKIKYNYLSHPLPVDDKINLTPTEMDI